MVIRRSFGLLLLMSVLITCCETKEFSGARVSFSFPDADSLAVKIYHRPLLDQEVLAQFDLDTAKRGVVQLELSNPLMLSMIINGNLYDLYLKPGYDLKLSRDTTFQNSILFEGKGALLNNYINQISALVLSDNFLDYDIDIFTRKYDSLNIAVEEFSKSYFDRFPMEKQDLELLTDIKKIKLLSEKTWYAYRKRNDAAIDQVFKFQKGEPIGEIAMLNELQIFFSDIPFDNAYLTNGMFNYRNILDYYLWDKHNSVIDPKLWDGSNREWPASVSAQWPRRVNMLIKGRSYPIGIKEYLMATELQHWMESQGITPGIDSIFNEFKTEFNGSIYEKSLQKDYDKKFDIRPGTVASDFSGKTLEGKMLSLKDFNGKVVYVDVWASWCSPCLEEIPYAQNLHKSFQKDEVIFLNVSIDRSRVAWKKMLDIEKDWHGTHIILDQQALDTFARNYKLGPIPRYLLIDKAGKIVSADASRPSSQTIQQEIASLLN
ncbi:MAG TPA: TlpA disulfide reductase family protein [Chryseolinea sp.]